MKQVDLEKYGIDRNRLPRHIAIIMDGNGRWARQHGMPRSIGHREGAKSVRDIVETAGVIGIKYLTLYTFSEENWNRPKKEITSLMNLLQHLLRKEAEELNKNNVRLSFIGRLYKFPENVRAEMERAKNLTASNTGLNLTLALSYGGRSEIIDGIRKILADPSMSSQELSEDRFRKYLYDPELPDPDLLIRTSGELRVSNFLLWQIAYTEIWVTPVLWPDFRTEHLLQGIAEYQKRKRRFGRVDSTLY